MGCCRALRLHVTAMDAGPGGGLPPRRPVEGRTCHDMPLVSIRITRVGNTYGNTVR
jgi:hypothetical protein